MECNLLKMEKTLLSSSMPHCRAKISLSLMASLLTLTLTCSSRRLTFLLKTPVSPSKTGKEKENENKEG